MPEPTLRDIEQNSVDVGLSGVEPSVVYDNSETLRLINQNSRYKAENDWRKYQQFLGDYQNRLQNQQEIADKQVADSDRDYLKKQSIDLFADALKDPHKIYSPEFNSKLAGIRSQAVSSKAARDFAEQNAQFILMHPEFNTDENKKKIDDYLNGQTVKDGGRKMFTLDVPDIFDNVKYFDSLKKNTAQTIDASYVSPDQQFIHERQDTKYGYKPFIEQIKLGYDSNPKIQKKAKKDFDTLPEEIKRNFEDAKDYWVNFGSKHFGSYDDIVEQGKENISPNSNFKEAEKLAETKRHNKATESISWGNLKLGKDELDFKKIKEKNPATTEANNGLVPYWDNYLLPQITSKERLTGEKKTGSLWWKKIEKLSPNYTGDIDIKSDDVSGLGVALFGELTGDGKQKGYTEKSKTKIRYDNGKPVGIVIDDVFYNKLDIDSKATKAENKSVSNKLDSPIFQEQPVKPQKPSWAE